jgi:hypothetical protein
MGFRLRRFRRTVESTTKTENCRAYLALEPLLLRMSNERHISELITVNLANAGALALSLSEAEQWIRVTGCLLAAIYTALKIVEVIKSLRK